MHFSTSVNTGEVSSECCVRPFLLEIGQRFGTGLSDSQSRKGCHQLCDFESSQKQVRPQLPGEV